MCVGDETDDPMSARQAAALLGVSERQVWRYVAAQQLTARDGLLVVQQTQPGKLFDRAEVLRLKREREGGSSEPNV
jgi:hypothetical protein